MAALTQSRSTSDRQPGDYVAYSGASGYNYYEGAMVMKDATGAIIRPMVQGAGASNGRFLGVVAKRVDLTAGLGASQAVLNLWKTGIFTFAANGTGVSAHIGQRAYAIDDGTVGVSAAVPTIYVGEITAVSPTSSFYRVNIGPAINEQFISGLSGFNFQN